MIRGAQCTTYAIAQITELRQAGIPHPEASQAGRGKRRKETRCKGTQEEQRKSQINQRKANTGAGFVIRYKTQIKRSLSFGVFHELLDLINLGNGFGVFQTVLLKNFV